ncbi:lipocalin family protein [Campylobacter taeniopygiae]|uniref:lipocalin family protein n=1 Tax=Campylobacter taeniopygiae TaxID=2510188 RepID=UPI003D6AB856
MIELIGDINLQNYMGEWLEIARKPNFFQKACQSSKAKYTLKYKGETPYIEIENFCQKENEILSIKGKAKLNANRKLAVSFNFFMNLFNKTNYEIIFIDTEYQVAIVGSPDKKYLWILARKKLDEATLQELLKIAKERNFDISDLIFDR